MAENEAAWITAPAENPFRVGSAPKPKPGAGQVVIRNRAVAIVSPTTPKTQCMPITDCSKESCGLENSVSG
jgi:hypothetical protein